MSPIYTPGKLTLAKNFTWNETIWNPSMISTALWLDAADTPTVVATGGVVSEWRDKSGNARHAVASGTARPSYSATGFNGLPGITFDGSDDQMIHGLTSGGAVTLIAVYKINSAQTGYRGIIAVGPATSSGSMLLARTSTSFIGSYGSTDINSLTAYANGQSVIAIMEDDDGTATKSFWINGSASGTFTSNPIGQPVSHIGGLNAAQAPSGSQNTAFSVAECIAAPSVASSINRQRIEGYLAHKWGLTANLPSDHPYKTVGPTP